MRLRIKKVTATELILKLLMLFSILTVVQGIPAFEHINKVLIAGIVFVLVIRLCAYRYNVKEALALYALIILHICALYFTVFPLEHVNMLFYFALWVMLYVFFAKSRDDIMAILKNAKGYIVVVLWIWTILVGVSACIPSCYMDSFFLSFTGSSFRLMPAVLIVTALAIYMKISTNDNRYELFLILPTYAAFMNQSRTYFGVYVIFFVMYLYMRIKSKRMFYAALIPMTGIIMVIMTFTGIMDKIVATQYKDTSFFDFWGTITSGRTVFWKWDLDAFFALPFWQQFVGNGFNFVYDVNGANMARIWAHNDIINILMNFGYIGVIIYCWAFSRLIKAYWPKDNQVPQLVKLMFLGAVFINSMMNMSYTYLCAMISYPFFLCAISAKYEVLSGKTGLHDRGMPNL